MNHQPIVTRLRQAVDAELRDLLAPRRLPLYDMMRYHLGWIDEEGRDAAPGGGKALRPVICLMACEAVGGRWETALPAAAALELVHNYSLIHDDIQDDDPLRRHRPTVWALWGKAQAINAGTAMRMLAGRALDRLDPRRVDAERRLRLAAILDETTIALLEGQYRDIDGETNESITVDDYLVMIEGKTAALIAAAMETGALIGGASPALAAGLAAAGREWGLAFQMRDDLLGIWGDPARTGKVACGDIRRRKRSLPVLHAREQGGAAGRAVIDALWRGSGDCGDEEIARVLAVMDATGSRRAVEDLVRRHADAAAGIVATLPLANEAARELLRYLASITAIDQ